MRRNGYSIFVVLAALAMVLSACSGTAATAAPTVAPTTAPAQPTVAPTTAPEQHTVAPTTEVAASPTPAEAPVSAELPAVDPAALSGNIIAAGSSTVYPLAERLAERFTDEGFTGQITIDSIGSGAGFERFCKTGETDIATASRAIKEAEVTNCAAINRTPIEIRVGTDALAVVVSSENTFLTGLTLEQLADVFSGKAAKWSDVDPAYPAEAILRFSPGTDSGTFDYFVEAVMRPVFGQDNSADKNALLNASGTQFSEDDNILVQGVEGSPYAIGYFGYAYYAENQGKLKAIAVNAVEPNLTTAEDGSYPLSRPLFLYTDARIMADKPQVAAFINFFLTNVNDEIQDVGYFPASDEALAAARQAWLDAAQ